MKLFKVIIAAVAAMLLVASCGLSTNYTQNLNLNQTEVVLSKANFHVVKQVVGKASATYWCGIGGASAKSLQGNAITEMIKNAELTGSQAIINVTFKRSDNVVLIMNNTTWYAEGTVIQFDE